MYHARYSFLGLGNITLKCIPTCLRNSFNFIEYDNIPICSLYAHKPSRKPSVIPTYKPTSNNKPRVKTAIELVAGKKIENLLHQISN